MKIRFRFAAILPLLACSSSISSVAVQEQSSLEVVAVNYAYLYQTSEQEQATELIEVYSDAQELQGGDTPAPAPPVCSGGIRNGPTGDVCCAGSCGSCGGPGCSSRPGGASQCCVTHIRETTRFCSIRPPACRIR